MPFTAILHRRWWHSLNAASVVAVVVLIGTLVASLTR